MRVSERKGCLQTLPSGSILDKTPFCQFKYRRPRPSGTPSNLEGDVHGAVHTISTTPPDLPCRRGGVLKWYYQSIEKYLLITLY